MAFKARVYLHRPGAFEGIYIGEIEVELRPVQNGRATFTYAGTRVTGRIDTIEPLKWETSGVIPTIHVAESHLS